MIIDDDPYCIEDLSYLIKKGKLPVDILASATSGEEGLAMIKEHKPELVFLDIVMPGMSGFEMVEKIPEIDFNLVVTTSVDKYAIQAIRASAIDFLVKPVRMDELSMAVNRILEKQEIPTKQQLPFLQNMLQQRARINKIALTISDGVQLVKLEDILYFKSDGNYTNVFFKNEMSMLVSRQIGKFEEILSEESFFRIHASYLINLNYVNKYIRSDGGYVVMENGENITVARNRKDEFLDVLGRV